MNIARVIVLGVAVATAGASAFLVRNVITQDGPAAASTENTLAATRVLVASRNLGLGETIQSGDLTWQSWPEEGLSLAYVNEKSHPNARATWTGSFVRVPFVAGEPVTRTKLVAAGSEGVMSAILSPGMRAVGIEISVESGAGGFILPNDRVDVILTYKYEIDLGNGRQNAFDSQTVMEMFASSRSIRHFVMKKAIQSLWVGPQHWKCQIHSQRNWLWQKPWEISL